MLPLPLPEVLKVRSSRFWLKVAVTDSSAFMVTEQVPVPEQPPPLQPANVEPEAAVAVRVTTVPVA